jgi:hypothetical protein
MKAPSPLLGYNNNVRHNGKVFHIQTEDSGVRYGHIITHLFMDGGRILKSVKTSYSEYIGAERMSDIVREMMKQQHKAMFIALRDGKFDAIADGSTESTSGRSTAGEPSPKAAATPSSAAKSPPAAVQASKTPTPAPPQAQPQAQVQPQPQPPVQSQAHAEVDAPATVRQPPAELTLDIDALERAAASHQAAAPVLRAAGDLPPPPANLFREKAGTGKYRVTPGSPAPSSEAPPAPPPRPAPTRRSPQTTTADRRYAPTRPAAIFGQARPQQGKSIFGEDLISDKSLDEVILSYLAEDLDEKK